VVVTTRRPARSTPRAVVMRTVVRRFIRARKRAYVMPRALLFAAVRAAPIEAARRRVCRRVYACRRWRQACANERHDEGRQVVPRETPQVGVPGRAYSTRQTAPLEAGWERCYARQAASARSRRRAAPCCEKPAARQTKSKDMFQAAARGAGATSPHAHHACHVTANVVAETRRTVTYRREVRVVARQRGSAPRVAR